MSTGISLGMIVRNEERTLRECLESVAPFVQEIVIGLGGESTDSTEQIAREFTNKVIQLEWQDDFSAARNEVLEHCTKDYFLWIDGDDTISNAQGLLRAIEQHPNIDAFYLGYDYGRDEQGNNICYLIRERLVKRHRELPVDYKWVGRIHEVLIPQFPNTALKLDDVMVIHHKPPGKHDPDRNLKILSEQLTEQEPNPDPRLLVYLGAEVAGRGEHREAIRFWQRFVKLSGWDEEKYQAQHHIADQYKLLEDLPKALKADFDAIEILPDWPDAYFGLADTYYRMQNYKACIEWTKIGASKPQPQTMLILNPLEYSYQPMVVLGLAYTQLGDWEMALQNFKNAWDIKREDLVANQIRLLDQERRMKQVVDSFLTVREFLGRNDEWLKIRKLYDCVPKLIEGHPAIMETWQRSMRQTAHVVEPDLVKKIYQENEEWFPIPDSDITDKWKNFPRSVFAVDVAKRIGAKKVVDWGSADGFTSLPVAMQGIEVVGFDIDPRCVAEANRRAKEWNIPARYEVGDLEDIGGVDKKADLALLFEVIEHQVDPADTLRKMELTANHIAITTPYLAFDAGNVAAWDDDRLKGHLRIFDQYDLERLLTPRGRIWNLYHEPWPPSNGWLLADYEPGATTDMTIIIGAFGTVEEWNPRFLKKEGLGGSETALVKLAEGLANRGHRVIVYSRIDEPGYYNGVCYRDQTHFRPEIKADALITWRAPEVADWTPEAGKLILWMHDTDSGDRITEERMRRYDQVVVLTNWHKEFMKKKYPFIPDKKFVIIGNGVDLTRFTKKIKRNPKRVIYSSSPDRGLDVILEGIWPKVVEAVPDAELHIYYGWKSFDATTKFLPHLKVFKDKINYLLSQTVNITQHGRIPQEKLAKEFLRSSLWLYPTYFTETYCITAIEAQLAGVVPITNHLAGLKETVAGGVFIEGDVLDSKVQDDYAAAVIENLREEPSPETRKQIQEAVPARSWDWVAEQWESLLRRNLNG